MKELKFSQVWPERMGEWAGKDTDFRSKIWAMLHDDHGFFQYGEMTYEWQTDYNDKVKDSTPKLHTIRRGQKYQAGDIVKPISVSPDGEEFQFAPEMKIASVQDIEIRGYSDRDSKSFWVRIDSKPFGRIGFSKHTDRVWTNEEIIEITSNDGFDAFSQFFKYFNKDFQGQILHFTDLRY